MEISETPIRLPELELPVKPDVQENQPTGETDESRERVELGDPRGDPTETDTEITGEKISADDTMDFSTSISDLQPTAPMAQPSAQMIAAPEPEPEQKKKGGMLDLGNLTAEQKLALMVAIACFVAHLEPVQKHLRSAIGRDEGMGWLAASSVLAGLVFIMIKRMNIIQ